MKAKKKVLLSVAVLMAASLTLTACNSGKAKEDVDQAGDKIEAGVDDVKDKLDEDKEKVDEKADEDRVKVETMAKVDEVILKDFKHVEVKDFRAETDIDDPKQLYILDLKLHLNVEDKVEAETLIEDYSQVLFDTIYADKGYTEMTIEWTTPSHEDSNKIVKEDYRG